MNREEFIGRLTELLGEVSPMERDEAIQYYNDYFDDAGAENESSVIASLGTPEELAGSIKAGLNDGGNGGEFTESGFSGYTQNRRDEVIKAGDADGRAADGTAKDAGRGASWNGGAGASAGNGARNNNAYYQGEYYQRADGDGVYGGRTDTRRQDNPYEQTASGSAGSGGGMGGQSAPQKQGMSGGTLAVLVIVAVLTSPIWIGLLVGLFGITVGLLATLFGIFLTFLVLGVAFVVVAIALLVTGILVMFSAPFGGMCMIGSALIVFAIGLVCIWLMVVVIGTAVPVVIRGIVSLFQRIFHRGGARA